MSRFSQRMGFVDIEDAIQLESIDEGLSNDIFNYVDENFMNFPSKTDEELWIHFFKMPKIQINYSIVDDTKRKVFEQYGLLPFYKKYDFLEYCLNEYSTGFSYFSEANKMLEENNSGYRFLNRILVPVHDKTELNTIKKAMNSKFDDGHIEAAVKALGKRKNPNYTTVQKEAIDAVEVASSKVATTLYGNKSTDTLGVFIKSMKKNGFLNENPAYISVLDKLYTYTNTGGVRHPDKEGTSFDKIESTFMLSVCSAYVNMLKARFAEKVTNSR